MGLTKLEVDASGGHGRGVEVVMDGVKISGLHSLNLDFKVNDVNHAKIDFYAAGVVEFNGTVELGYVAKVVVRGPTEGVRLEYAGFGPTAKGALEDLVASMPEVV